MKVASPLPRSLRTILLGCILLTLALRAHQVFTAPFDEDELRAFHLAWQVANGGVMWEEIKPLMTPLLPLLHVPVFRLLGDEISVLFVLRVLNLTYYGLFLLLFFLVGRHLAHSRAALFAVFFVSTFGFSISKTAEFRPNSLALFLLMLTVWLYLRRDRHGHPVLSTLLASVLLGIAYNVYEEALLCFPAFALHQGLLVILAKKPFRREAVFSMFAFVLGFTATLLLFLLVPFSPVKLVHSLYLQFLMYVITPSFGPVHPGVIRQAVFDNAPFLAIAVLGIGCVIRTLPPSDPRRTGWFFWFLLVGSGVLRLLASEKIFLQYFLLLGTALALPAGVFLDALVRRLSSISAAGFSLPARMVPATICLVIAVQGMYTFARDNSAMQQVRSEDAALNRELFTPSGQWFSLDQVEDRLTRTPYQRPFVLTQTLPQQLAFLEYGREHLGMSRRAFDGSSTYVFANDSPNFNPPDLTNMYGFFSSTYNLLQKQETFLGVPRARFGNLYGAAPGTPLDQALKEDFERYPPDIIVYDPWVRWMAQHFPSVYAFFNHNYRFRYVPMFNNLIGFPLTQTPLLSSDLPLPPSPR